MIRRPGAVLPLLLLLGCASEIDPNTQAVTPEGVVVPRVTASQLASLHWIEGTWRVANDSLAFVQRYRFVDDSTISVETTGESASPSSDTVYFAIRDGWFGTRGSGERWAASQFGPRSVTFVPIANTLQGLLWEYRSPDVWIVHISTPKIEDHPEREDVFELHRVAERSR